MPILTQTYEGAPGGMNLFLPAQQLDDTEVRYSQDLLFDIPGEIHMRGPISPISGFASTAKPGTSLVQTLDPNGAARFAVLNGDNSVGNFSAYAADLTSKTDLPWNGVLPTQPSLGLPYRNVDSKSCLNGGSLVGSSSAYDSNSPIQTLAFWKGGNKADYATGTVTLTRGGTALAGSGTTWVGNVVAGEFIFGSTDDGYTNTFIGVVQSVNSNTSITLVDPSPYPMTAKAYNATSLRGFQGRIGTGRITAATSAATVNGGATKFATQKMGTGTWNIYRASDWAWVGKVLTVTSDIQVTLAANAAVACNNESYIALRADGDWSINTMAVANNKMGFLNATYADRQWYANNGQKFQYTSRVWFSSPNDPELVDLSINDGNFIDIGSSTGANTPIKALMPAYNALIVMKDNETYGIFGTSTDSFDPRKISDDGVINGMSVQPYSGGVIWAGRNGIYYYDGNQATNMTAEKLGASYKTWVKSFDSTTYRMWSMVSKNHYFLFLESFQTDTAVIKGTVSTSPTQITIVINMDTGSVTTLRNLNIRGSVVLPAATGGTTWFLVNGQRPGDTADQGFICDSAQLFEQTGRDTLYSDYSLLGTWTNMIPNGGAEVDATLWSVNAWANLLAQSSAQAKYGSKSFAMTSINSCVNGDFETNTTGWSGFNGGAISRVTTEHFSGAASMQVITTVTVNSGALGAEVAVAAGQPYQVTAWVKGPIGQAVNLTIFEEDGAFAFLRGGNGGVLNFNGGWQKLSFSATAGAGTVFIKPLIINNGGSVMTFFIDDVRIAQGFAYFASPVGDLGGGMRMGMVAGQTYTFSGWVYVPSTNGGSPGSTLNQVFLQLYDNNGGYNAVGSSAPVAYDTWTKLSVTKTIGAGATEAFLRVIDNETPNTYALVYFDGMQLELGSTAHQYVETTTVAVTGSPLRTGTIPYPDPYVESKKYAEGDSMRKKLFKQLALDYQAQGGALKIDTIVGLNNVGTTSLTQLPPTVLTWDQLAVTAVTWDALSALYPTWDSLINSVFKPTRVKFLKRSQHFAFRIYAADTNLTKFIVGPFQLGYKNQRPGRI